MSTWFRDANAIRVVRPGPLVLLLAIALVGLMGARTAQANTPVESFAMVPSTTQAGGHPDVLVNFELKNRYVQTVKTPCECQDAKSIKGSLPTGLVGNPSSTPKCTAQDFGIDLCPVDSQVGIAEIEVNFLGSDPGFLTPVYNLETQPGQAGLLGFKLGLFNTPQYTVVSSRTGSDYGVDSTVEGINHLLPLQEFKQVIWGVPADPIHDELRFELGEWGIGVGLQSGSDFCDKNEQPSTNDPNTVYTACAAAGGPPQASNSPLVPFFQNPTVCDVPLEGSVEVLSYDGGTSHASTPYPSTTGCDELSFSPSLAAKPTTEQADTPSGLDIDLVVPQFQSPTVPSPSEIRHSVVTLPEGFTINPNAADGKTSCSDVEARFGTEEQARCPEFAKVGTLEVHSSILPGVLPGAIYLGEPLPGNRYRLFLTADGFGVHVKLPGVVTPDPATGQLVASFKDLPQSPFEEFNMHFFGSERGLLATPTKCGTYAVKSTFTPWNALLPDQESTQFFTIDEGPGGSPCPGSLRPFAPSFDSSSEGNTAGSHTPFTVNVSRPDGNQNLSGLNVVTPPGFSAVLKGIPYCSEAAIGKLSDSSYSGLAEQASSSCPSASQIGTATAGAGAGTHPLYTPGKVYLAGPYKGAPLSLVVVIPAVSGPYDLGNVAVRAAINVDPNTARVSTVSDPLPQILEGIPLRLRSILVDLDRPNFALTPTNCDPFSVEATLFGAEGASLGRSSLYQVANCASLPFAPKLALTMSGPIKRTGHMALKANLSASGGEANIATTQVTLPKSQNLDNSRINNPCTKPQFAARACPETSMLGFAKAESPLLDKPLQGPVYLRVGNNKLPDLAVDLRGQIDVVLLGEIDTVNERIRTTFETIPDVPVSGFELNLLGGKRGLLRNNANVCRSPQLANIRMAGQNGAKTNANAKVATPCAKGRKAKRAKRKRLYRAKAVR